jgi:hypothetical protein
MSVAVLLDELEMAHGTVLCDIDDLATDDDGTVVDATLLATLTRISGQLASIIATLQDVAS